VSTRLRAAGAAILLAVSLAPIETRAAEPARPLALHTRNPRYFLFRGKPAVLVTSGEHYGAVLNRDFDYHRYLDELRARGFNLTRTFAGTYREVPGSFGIRGNTLAPAPGSFVCPWARGAVPGAADGGNKFDLEAFDPAYFARLEDFIREAGKRGIVVELVLFCTLYDDDLWAVSPMNPRNNVQGIGPESRLEVYSARDRALTAAQEMLVKRIAGRLRDIDNLYYEVCNEPYERPGLTPEWNDRIIRAIVEAEAAFPARHLIAQGIAVRSARITDPDPRVSVFNFHAAEPESVTQNAGLRKAIADDETGGKGTADFPYRSEGWEFLLAGGSVFSHLDFSFTCEHPDGTAKLEDHPGGGGPSIRKQIQVLKEFIESFDFVEMRPDESVIEGGAASAGSPAKPAGTTATARALVQDGRAYAVYLKGGKKVDLVLRLPAGAYRAEWIDTRTGETARSEAFEHTGGKRTLASPEFAEDIALRVKRTAGP
jgi:hypothetical protein